MKKRRLIGPIIISLVFCGLLSDYVYFRGSRWSVVSLISKIASILVAIFSPAFDPALYSWIDDIGLPASIITIVLILILLAIARAKSAMREATPNPEVAQRLPVEAEHTSQLPEIPPEYIAEPARRAFPRLGFLGKLTVSFGTVGILFGILVCAIAQSFVSQALEKEMKSRAEVMLLGLSDIASRDLSAGKIQDLAGEIARQASSEMIGYIYVEDPKGQIVVHEPKDLPIYLDREFPRSGELALKGLYGQYRGFAVYEIAKRTGKGNRGFIHLALWRSQVETESARAAIRIATAVVIALLVVIAVFGLVARHLNRPLFELIDRAERISKGDLALPLEIKSTDEIGEIARSLERMRSSLRAVTSRLEQTN